MVVNTSIFFVFQNEYDRMMNRHKDVDPRTPEVTSRIVGGAGSSREAPLINCSGRLDSVGLAAGSICTIEWVVVSFCSLVFLHSVPWCMLHVAKPPGCGSSCIRARTVCYRFLQAPTAPVIDTCAIGQPEHAAT